MQRNTIPAATSRPIAGAAQLLGLPVVRRLFRRGADAPRRTDAVAGGQRSNRAAAADLPSFHDVFGVGEGRARTELGHYYATSVSGT